MYTRGYAYPSFKLLGSVLIYFILFLNDLTTKMFFLNKLKIDCYVKYVHIVLTTTGTCMDKRTHEYV